MLKNLRACTFWVSSFNLLLLLSPTPNPPRDCQLQLAKRRATKGNLSERLTAVAKIARPTRIKTKIIGLLGMGAQISQPAMLANKSLPTAEEQGNNARRAMPTRTDLMAATGVKGALINQHARNLVNLWMQILSQ